MIIPPLTVTLQRYERGIYFDESMHMEAFKKSRYAGTLATYFRPVFRMAQELLTDVFVAKAHDHMFTSHEGCKKTHVLRMTCLVNRCR